MRIIFYCQYVLGMGHFFRSLQIARALSDHEVWLVVGGQKVAADLPGHVRLMRLPVLYMDEKFTTLMSGEEGQSVDRVQARREKILLDLLGEIRPDLFLVELYPFGRTIFQTELDPLLEKIGSGVFGNVRRVCSLRDVLVEKRDPVAYEQRVLGKLNRYFDLLLIHSDGDFLRLDETFNRVGDIAIPVYYTGFVTRSPAPGAADLIRKKCGVGHRERLIVASAGGGRTGFKMLKSVVAACRTLSGAHGVHLQVFTGPFIDKEEFEELASDTGPGISVRRFTKHLLDYLDAADLSISMAGYNTCMDLLVVQVPALVYPYTRQQEQPIRAEKIRHLLPMKVIGEDDLGKGPMQKHILDMLARSRPSAPLALDLKGAAHTARFLSEWARGGDAV
jgi:predicted glycosyltransferase